MTVTEAATPRAASVPAGKSRRRISEFDVMRGAAIIFVVYMHAWFSPWAVTPHREKLAVHVIHLFGHSAVPVFFFISAFLLGRDRRPGLGNFLQRKLNRIVIPTLFWMFATLAYRIWQDGWSSELGKNLLLFNVAGQYYYLIVLIILMAAFWPVRFVADRWLAPLLAASFVINLAAIVYYENSDVTGDFATFAYRNPAAWIFFYMFGYWAGRLFDNMDWTRRALPYALGVMALDAAVYFVRGEAFDSYPVSYFGVSIFLFSCSALIVYPALVNMLLPLRNARFVLRPLSDLSPYSFAIYLVHMPFFVGYVTENLVSDSFVKNDYWALMNSLFLVGFLTTLAFVLTVSHVLPRFAKEFMGVEPAPESLEPALATTPLPADGERAQKPPASV